MTKKVENHLNQHEIRLQKIIGNDPELKKELQTLFLETFDNSLNQIKAAIVENNPKKWLSALHELKGAADNMAFEDAGELCRQAESKPFNPTDAQIFHGKLDIIRKNIKF